MAILTKKTKVENKELIKAIFLLIATLFKSPNDEFKDDIESGRLQGVVDYLIESFGLEPIQITPPNWQDLEATYVELFLTNPAGLPAPPYLAYAIDNELYGESYKKLIELYSKNNLLIKDDFFDLPDHIAAVSEACLLLTEKENINTVIELSKDYFLPWFDKYSAAVSEIDNNFYGSLINLCQELLRRLLDEA